MTFSRTLAIITVLASSIAFGSTDQPSWEKLNEVDFSLHKGKDADCGDGSLRFSTEKNLNHVLFGPLLQFSFRNDQKVTETGEASSDTGCKLKTTTVAEGGKIHSERRSENCTEQENNNLIIEDFKIVDANTLEYNFNRVYTSKDVKVAAGRKPVQFRCVFKRSTVATESSDSNKASKK